MNEVETIGKRTDEAEYFGWALEQENDSGNTYYLKKTAGAGGKVDKRVSSSVAIKR